MSGLIYNLKGKLLRLHSPSPPLKFMKFRATPEDGSEDSDKRRNQPICLVAAVPKKLHTEALGMNFALTLI